MKAVIISIQSYYVFLIIARKMGWDIPQEKTVEVRKDFPKDRLWNKTVHIYCSKNRKSFNRIPKQYQPFMAKLLGKVVGQFVCDCIMKHCEMANADIAEQQGYIKRETLLEYANGKELFGWCISDLEIYDTPKELGEFRTPPCEKPESACDNCKYKVNVGTYYYPDYDCDRENGKPLTRPAQSWCYVEALS